MTRYLLQPENFAEIQKLVNQQASKLMTQGETRSRAMMKATDIVAAENALPEGAVTGVHLSRYLALQLSAARHLQAEQVATLSSVGLPFADADDFGGRKRNPNVVFNQLVDKLRPMRIGEVWSFQTRSQEESAILASYLSRVIRKLGWRTSKNQKVYKAQVLNDRLKIKRLS